MFLKNKNVIEFIRENKSNDIAINKILKGNEDLKNPLRNIPVITKYWYSNKILYFMLNSNDKFKVFMGGCHIKFNVSSIFVKDLPIDNAKLDILYKLKMLERVKDMLCRIKNGQLRNNVTGILQKKDMFLKINNKKKQEKIAQIKNVQSQSKSSIQALRLLEKEGFVNEKSPFNVYVVVTLFNNKIKAVKSLTRIYIRNILLKNIENISQMLDQKKDMFLKINNKKKQEKIAQIKNVQSQLKSSINGNGNIQEKIILVIFSIFSFCTSILTEGKIKEEKTLPPFIREALLSECPVRDVDNVNYPVIKGFAIIAKNGISALGHGVLDLVGFNNSTKTSISFSQHFIERLPLAIKDSIIQNNTNILSNISVKSLINISDLGLKTSSGFLNNALFFMHEHRSEGLYVTSVIACLFLAEYFDLCGAKNLKASKNKQILLDADSLRQECAEAQKKMFVFLHELGPKVEAQLDLERAQLVDKAIAGIRAQITADVAQARLRLAESTAARAVGSPISPPPTVGATGGSGGGGAIGGSGSTAVTLLSVAYKKALQERLMENIKISVISPIINGELACFFNTSNLSEEIINELIQNQVTQIEKDEVSLKFDAIFNTFVEKKCGGAIITSATTAFVNTFSNKALIEQNDFIDYTLVELTIVDIAPDYIKKNIHLFLDLGASLIVFDDTLFENTFKKIIVKETLIRLNLYCLQAEAENVFVPGHTAEGVLSLLHSELDENFSTENFNAFLDTFLKQKFKTSNFNNKKKFKKFLYNQIPGDLDRRIEFLFSFKNEIVNFWCENTLKKMGFAGDRLSPPTVGGATGGESEFKVGDGDAR